MAELCPYCHTEPCGCRISIGPDGLETARYYIDAWDNTPEKIAARVAAAAVDAEKQKQHLARIVENPVTSKFLGSDLHYAEDINCDICDAFIARATGDLNCTDFVCAACCK